MASATDEFAFDQQSGSGEVKDIPLPGEIEEVQEEKYPLTKEKEPLPTEPPPPYEANPGPSSKSNMAGHGQVPVIQQTTEGNVTMFTTQHAPSTSTTIIVTNTSNHAPLHNPEYYKPRFCDKVKLNVIMCIVFPPWIVVWIVLWFMGV